MPDVHWLGCAGVLTGGSLSVLHLIKTNKYLNVKSLPCARDLRNQIPQKMYSRKQSSRNQWFARGTRPSNSRKHSTFWARSKTGLRYSYIYIYIYIYIHTRSRSTLTFRAHVTCSDKSLIHSHVKPRASKPRAKACVRNSRTQASSRQHLTF